ncbi:hypothetical protein Tco_1503037 [Tanacetum coccineum]
MADLTFADSHYMVAYLEKSEDNADFAEIVDIFIASPIKYALTTIVITESSVRRDLYFNDEDGINCLTNTEIFENLQLMGVERAATTTASLDAEQGSGNINRTQSTAIPNDPFPQGIGSGGSPRRQDTMRNRPAQTRFETLSKQSNEPPLSEVTLRSGAVLVRTNAQALEIQKLKKRVKKLESKKKSRTPQLKRRLFKFQEDLETQGRYGHDIGVNTASTSITTTSINMTTVEPVTTASAPITTANVSVSTAEPMRNQKKNQRKKGVSRETATRLARGVIMKEASKTATRPTVPPPQINLKDKGKGIMQEPEKPVKVKGKDQIKYDVDVAQRLQAKLDEKAGLEREREEEANYELAAKLQAEEQGEISIEERSKLFVELMNERKKHFARLRAEEQRRKPLTKVQKRNQMSNYLKNMAGYTLQQL